MDLSNTIANCENDYKTIIENADYTNYYFKLQEENFEITEVFYWKRMIEYVIITKISCYLILNLHKEALYYFNCSFKNIKNNKENLNLFIENINKCILNNKNFDNRISEKSKEIVKIIKGEIDEFFRPSNRKQ